MLINRRRIERLSRLIWPVGEQLASPLAQLLLTPFLLHRLGAFQFGLWVLALTPLIAASSLSLGRSSSLLAVVPRWAAQSRLAAVGPTVWRVLRLTAMTSLAALLFVAVAQSWLAPLLPSELEHPLRYIVLVVVLVAMSEAENTVTSALKGLGQFKVAALAELFGRSVQLLAVFSLVTGSSGASTVILIAVAVSLLKFLIKGEALRRQLPKGPVAAPDLNNDLHVDLRRTGLWMWLQVMCGLVFYSFDRWVVGYLFGASTLAAYAICSQLAQLSHAIPAAAAQPLIPWAATHAASLATPGTAKAVARTAVMAGAAASIIPLAVTLFAEPLLRLWISPAFAQQYAGIASGLGLVFLVLALNVPFFNLLIGWGQTRFASMLTVTASGFFVLACLAIRPSHLHTVVALKMGYAIIGLYSVVELFRYVHRAQHPSR
jgi:O-antigen/teichoic acid export membrane protein